MDTINELAREVRAAWTDGCNCCICLQLELREQGKANHYELTLEVLDSAGRRHGDGWWCMDDTPHKLRVCNGLRLRAGWPERGPRPESGSGRPRRPMFRLR